MRVCASPLPAAIFHRNRTHAYVVQAGCISCFNLRLLLTTLALKMDATLFIELESAVYPCQLYKASGKPGVEVMPYILVHVCQCIKHCMYS